LSTSIQPLRSESSTSLKLGSKG